MDSFDWSMIGVGIVAILALALVGFLLIPHDDAVIHSTYEEGFEISHMETAGKHFVISARNDKDSFSIAVDSATFARFIVGDVVHVKVTVYENEGHYYNKYEIMGREGWVQREDRKVLLE